MALKFVILRVIHYLKNAVVILSWGHKSWVQDTHLTCTYISLLLTIVLTTVNFLWQIDRDGCEQFLHISLLVRHYSNRGKCRSKLPQIAVSPRQLQKLHQGTDTSLHTCSLHTCFQKYADWILHLTFHTDILLVKQVHNLGEPGLLLDIW